MKENIDKFNALISTNIVGYNEHFTNLINLYKTQKLPKVILLSGEKGSGKFTFAFHFINYVLSLNSKFPYSYDKMSINKENESYKKILLNVEQNYNYIGSAKPNQSSIEDIRELKKKFYKSTLDNKPRFTVLDDVELMNLNAANALLKLIEEPSIYDYFFLINNKKKNMIETLKSRSIEIKIFLDLKKKNDIFSFLQKKFGTKNNFFAKHLDSISPGSLIRFSDISEKAEIDGSITFQDIIIKLLQNFKKNKDPLYLDFINFLIDIEFIELSKNNRDPLSIIEIKNKLSNLFDQYRKYNLNNNTVLNQFKILFSHVR